MPGGGSQTSGTTTAQPPQYIQDEGKQNYAFAQTVANRPFVQNPFLQQAPFSQDQLAAQAGVRDLQGQSAAALQPAFSAAQQSAGYTPSQVTAASFNPSQVQSIMNPYTQSVLNPSIQLAQQNLANQNNQLGAQANAAGAFGGSRQAVQEGVNAAQTNLGLAQLSGQLNSQAYQNAVNTGLQYNTLGQQAGASNQQAGLTGDLYRTQAANTLGGLAAQNNALTSNELNALSTSGTQQQQLLQNQLGYGSQQFQNQWNYPYQQLGTLTSALSAQPFGTTTTNTVPGQNPLITGLGAASSGAALGGALGGALAGGAAGSVLPGVGTAIGAVGGGLLGLFSDRKAKTDISKVGNIMPGIDAYAFRYKGDPKTYPKTVGPMAEDVEKKFPGSTMNVGGKMVIHPRVAAVLSNSLNSMMPKRAA